MPRRSTSSTSAWSAPPPAPARGRVHHDADRVRAPQPAARGRPRLLPQPGIGAAVWLHATDVQDIHDALAADGHRIVSAPIDGPFGRTFTFADPDGYHVTLHDRA
ncbi:VOC family protein [Klenkia terrae]